MREEQLDWSQSKVFLVLSVAANLYIKFLAPTQHYDDDNDTMVTMLMLREVIPMMGFKQLSHFLANSSP